MRSRFFVIFRILHSVFSQSFIAARIPVALRLRPVSDHSIKIQQEKATHPVGFFMF